MPSRKNQFSTSSILSLLLTAAVLVCYGDVRLNGFLVMDDDRYVTNNPFIKDGVTWDGIAWAMTSIREANWHPLTWISHMLDIEWHRFDAPGHHATSVLLHAGNTVLLFLLVAALVGTRWPGFLVAALFGVHPLHVESVAWIAERKEVLSVLCFLAAVGAYLQYARGRRRRWYVCALLAFLLGLASKPMVVTLPFALLLLDFWPLGRLLPAPGTRWGQRVARMLLEKLPFLALSAGSAVMTLFAQGKAGAVASWSLLPLSTRLANATVSYAGYLAKTLFPVGLSAIYPLIPARLTAARVGGSLFLLVLVTAALLLSWRRRPALVVGWLWFLWTLVPVIGIVQVGVQGMADRYTYLPHIGLFVALVWGWRSFELPLGRMTAVVAAAMILAPLALMTRVQVTRWRTTGTLLQHAITVDPGNYQAWYMLGVERAGRGDNQGAVAAYRQALTIRPEHVESRYRLATTHLGMGNSQAAYREYLLLRTAAPPIAAELLRFISATMKKQQH